MSSILRISDIKVGDVCTVGFITGGIGRPRERLVGMATDVGDDAVVINSVVISGDGRLNNDSTMVSQYERDLPQLRSGRKVLSHYPQYRACREPGAMISLCGRKELLVPTGLTLNAFAKYDEGSFLMGLSTFPHPHFAASFVPPFHDWKTGKIVWQHASVFKITTPGAKLKVVHDVGSGKHRHILPEDAEFTKVDEGNVARGSVNNTLILGDYVLDAKRREYPLYGDNQFFAIETSVLKVAGLAG